uniref:Uncharacterized protein n=1 Tax=Oscillatoriales cyanobacterium SpSt-418 TaxID=2282169 RepID=A0A7C3PI40_9CYAN
MVHWFHSRRQAAICLFSKKEQNNMCSNAKYVEVEVLGNIDVVEPHPQPCEVLEEELEFSGKALFAVSIEGVIRRRRIRF